MDTSILHTRILEYKAKAKNPVSQEMISMFETWFVTIESYVSDLELDNFRLEKKVEELHEGIDLLSDLLIISGNTDILFVPDFKDKYTRDAVTLLLKSRDRKNFKSIVAISALLQLNPDTKFDSIKQLKEHASRG